ncbi:hypothetical protein MKZ38_000632 [Zalerion maritima]|uniref:Uncharacterized protein n=1 Tax=Zalerion maritima TaxID=339359 RepID=A0AAD5RRA7_9PEZI|nr:hypothetical protein MKZ38_000632 [Zalerion maritima]
MVLRGDKPPIASMARKPVSISTPNSGAPLSPSRAIFSRPYCLMIPAPVPDPLLMRRSPFCSSRTDTFVFEVDTHVLPQPSRAPHAVVPIMHLSPSLPGPLTEAENNHVASQALKIRQAFYDAVTTVLCHLYGRSRAIKVDSLSGWHVRSLDQVIRDLNLSGSGRLEGFTAREEWRDALVKAEGVRGDLALPHLYRSYYDAGDFKGWAKVAKIIALRADQTPPVNNTEGHPELVVSGESPYFLIPTDILLEINHFRTSTLAALREEAAHELRILRRVPPMTTAELLRLSTQSLEPCVSTPDALALAKRNSIQLNLIHLSRAWYHFDMGSRDFALGYTGAISDLVQHMLAPRIANDPLTQLDCVLWSLHWAAEGKTRDVESQAVRLVDGDLGAFWQETKIRREDWYVQQETERLMDMLVVQQSKINIT